ncbi:MULTISPECIES: GNAT family N-acetyltransferase [Prochlorococcus]|uniref:GNAT family N-acetyltransferase n=1 Tax=Prochlorococcus TaxID=1218 RepID=UPI0005337C40|nr:MULTISPECIES: GNAT family N-acetyltransferase [Prochlorococcus]KGG12093.1 surface polysaccharide biosynthesis protein [Prochlorococcus sp. MIT 0601]
MSGIEVVKAGYEHSKVIWQWRNDPLTRRMFISEDEISWEEHMIWYEKLIEDNSRKLYVGILKDLPIGVVRFDNCFMTNKSFDISINISPSNRGQGIGKALLGKSIKIFSQEVKSCRLIRAEIKNHNLSSIRIFTSCGFISSVLNSQTTIFELSI